MLRLILALTLYACALTGLAQGRDVAQGAVAKLAQAGELSCRPSWPVFCSNLHVSCSGPQPIRAFAFKLNAKGAVGSIEPAAALDAPDAAAGMKLQFQNSRVEWDAAGAYVILSPRLANGYIKLSADGAYSFRHYVQDAGTMSIGRCD